MESKTLKANVEVKISVREKFCYGCVFGNENGVCFIFAKRLERKNVMKYSTTFNYWVRCKECLETFGE